MRDCAKREFERANGELERLDSRLRITLKDRQRRLFDEAEQAWRRYRDANCASHASLFEGGTLESLTVMACMEDLTTGRVKELRQVYGRLLNEEDAAASSPDQ